MTVGGQPVLNGHIPAPEAFLCGPSQLAPVDGQGMYRLVVILNRFLGFIATIIERSFIYQFNSTTLFALNSFSMSTEKGAPIKINENCVNLQSSPIPKHWVPTNTNLPWSFFKSVGPWPHFG